MQHPDMHVSFLSPFSPLSTFLSPSLSFYLSLSRARALSRLTLLQQNVTDMVVKPVILTKGTCKIAIYGIGNIKDERLHEVFFFFLKNPAVCSCLCFLMMMCVRARAHARAWVRVRLCVYVSLCASLCVLCAPAVFQEGAGEIRSAKSKGGLFPHSRHSSEQVCMCVWVYVLPNGIPRERQDFLCEYVHYKTSHDVNPTVSP